MLTVDPAVRVLDGDDGLLLVHERTGRCYRCAGTAAEAWRALAEHGDDDRAARQVAEHHGVATDRARRDLDKFVAALTVAQLLHQGSRS